MTFDRGFTGSGTSISMRGVSSSSLDAGLEQSVLLDFDGMPISRGRILNDALFDVQAIEVMKGPQSLFFGKNTPGGVVSVRSADPTRTAEGYARVGYEVEASAPSFEGAVSGPLSDTVAYRVAGFYTQSEGYIRNSNAGIADPFRAARLPTDTGGTFVPAAPRRLGAERKYGARVSFAYDAGGDFDASLKMLVTRSRNQGLQSFSEVMSCAPGVSQPRTNSVVDPNGDCALDNRAATGFIAPAIIAAWPEIRSWNTGEPQGSNDSFLPVLTLNWNAGPVTVTSTTSMYDYEYRSSGSADATSYAFFWSYQNEKFRSIVQEVRAVSSTEGAFDFAVGGYYEDSERTLKAGALNGPNARDAATGKYHTHDNRWDNNSSAWSVFGQLIWRPTPTLEAAAGARFTKEDRDVSGMNTFVNASVAGFRPANVPLVARRSEDKVSPEATLTWRPGNGLMVYGAYKTGYLAGGFSNLGTLTAGATAGTLTYGATEADGFEVGTKYASPDGGLSASLIGYRYSYEGLQLTTFNATLAQPSFTTTNAADTRVQGIELEAMYRPTEGLALRGTAGYSDAKYLDFKGAQCYAGQTTAQGCTTLPNSTARGQDLSGTRLWRAPQLLFTAGATYEFPVGPGLLLGFNADARRSSGYYVSVTRNPGSYQPAFTTLNAGVRLGSDDGRWAIAVIGRNVTDEIVASLGTDKPGGSGEVFAVASEPRAVVLQLETRF